MHVVAKDVTLQAAGESSCNPGTCWTWQRRGANVSAQAGGWGAFCALLEHRAGTSWLPVAGVVSGDGLSVPSPLTPPTSSCPNLERMITLQEQQKAPLKRHKAGLQTKGHVKDHQQQHWGFFGGMGGVTHKEGKETGRQCFKDPIFLASWTVMTCQSGLVYH